MEAPPELEDGQQLSSGSMFPVSAETSQSAIPSQRAFLQRKGKVSKREPKDLLQRGLSGELCG